MASGPSSQSYLKFFPGFASFLSQSSNTCVKLRLQWRFSLVRCSLKTFSVLLVRILGRCFQKCLIAWLYETGAPKTALRAVLVLLVRRCIIKTNFIFTHHGFGMYTGRSSYRVMSPSKISFTSVVLVLLTVPRQRSTQSHQPYKSSNRTYARSLLT